jgi:hypothetical protein
MGNPQGPQRRLPERLGTQGIPERIFVDAEAGQEGIDNGDADFRGWTMFFNRIHRSSVRGRFFRH